MEADSVTPLKFKIVSKITNIIAITTLYSCKARKGRCDSIRTSRNTYSNS